MEGFRRDSYILCLNGVCSAQNQMYVIVLCDKIDKTIIAYRDNDNNSFIIDETHMTFL